MLYISLMSASIKGEGRKLFYVINNSLPFVFLIWRLWELLQLEIEPQLWNAHADALA